VAIRVYFNAERVRGSLKKVLLACSLKRSEGTTIKLLRLYMSSRVGKLNPTLEDRDLGGKAQKEWAFRGHLERARLVDTTF